MEIVYDKLMHLGGDLVVKTVKVSGKKELNVVLKEDTETLEEVVVVA